MLKEKILILGGQDFLTIPPREHFAYLSENFDVVFAENESEAMEAIKKKEISLTLWSPSFWPATDSWVKNFSDHLKSIGFKSGSIHLPTNLQEELIARIKLLLQTTAVPLKSKQLHLWGFNIF